MREHRNIYVLKLVIDVNNSCEGQDAAQQQHPLIARSTAKITLICRIIIVLEFLPAII
jgi:hypothetical protein